MNPCDNAPQHRQKHEREPQPSNILQINGGNAGNDHNVKEEAGNAVEQVVVLILADDHSGFASLLQQCTQAHGKSRPDDEVKPPDQRIQRGSKPCRDLCNAGGQAVSRKVGKEIDDKNKSNLHRQLIDGIRHRYLVSILKEVNPRLAFQYTAGFAKLPFARKNIQNNHAHNARHQISGCSDRQAEALPAGKPQGFIAGAHIVSLPGALAVAHRKQKARSLEKPRHQRIAQQKRDEKPRNTLNHIGADHNRTGF